MITETLDFWSIQHGQVRMLRDRDAMAARLDGRKICCNVYRPLDGQPVPAVVSMAPYGKDDLPFSYKVFERGAIAISEYCNFESEDPGFWVPEGYAVVKADCPGTYQSDGEWEVFSRSDGQGLHDLIEWVAQQSWCDGKVATSGVSYNAVIQWWAGSLRPPHLAAMIPYFGFTDCYRDFAHQGGIPDTVFPPNWYNRFAGLMGRDPQQLPDNLPRNMSERPIMDEYWAGKVPDVSAIEVPFYAVAGWASQGLHLRGTLEAFSQAASNEKWLEIHSGKEWETWHSTEFNHKRKRFLDWKLKGIPNGWNRLPRVHYRVRTDFYYDDYRTLPDWPAPGAREHALFLCADGTAGPEPQQIEASVSYDSAPGAGSAVFDHVFRQDTELTGSMKLRLWVEAESADDMDLFVGLQRLNADGELVLFEDFMQAAPVLAHGWLRVSLRRLDPDRSAPLAPWQTYATEEKLAPGEIGPADILIWPSSTQFRAGDTLRIVVQGSDVCPVPFRGHAQLTNSGRHVIHLGGKYDSHLLVPLMP